MRRVQFSFLTSTPLYGLTEKDVLVNFLPISEANRAMDIRFFAFGAEPVIGVKCYEVTVSFVPTEGMNYLEWLSDSEVISKLQIRDGLVTWRVK